MKVIKYLIYGALLFFGLLVVFYCYNSYNDDVIAMNENETTLVFANSTKVYVKAKSWGISGNHQEIIFSETAITKPNLVKDYVFYTDEVYYKIEGNKLLVYAPKSGKNIPKSTFNNIEIVFVGLKNYDEIQNYGNHYSEYGLQRISSK